ncbi:MAG: response regulator transcription factor [Bacteroidales bacterium]|jgi:DNA-binding NarL/FixJ family response regulator|nr:response regulator transcription factor [Bacteroidales bacterium]
MTKEITILIAEPVSLIAEGIEAVFEKMPQYKVVGLCEEFPYLFERLIVAKPEILILDPEIVDFSKRKNIKSLFQDYPKLLLIALPHQYTTQNELKQYDEIIELTDSFKRIDFKLTQLLNRKNKPSDGPAIHDLSEREKDVLIELSQGKMNKEIADKLHISVHTVITHRKNIVKKTGIKSVAGLTVYALLHHLTEKK